MTGHESDKEGNAAGEDNGTGRYVEALSETTVCVSRDQFSASRKRHRWDQNPEPAIATPESERLPLIRRDGIWHVDAGPIRERNDW